MLSRVLRGKAGRYRKDFSDFDEVKYNWLRRLSTFFKKYPDINMDTYFSAPYKLYPEIAYFDLQYFASPKGIKTYTVFKQQQRAKSPEAHIEGIKKSFSFITRFCLANNMPFSIYVQDVPTHVPHWYLHIKEGSVDPYTMIGSPTACDLIYKLGPEAAELYLGSFGENFMQCKADYLASDKLRLFLSEAYKRVENFIWQQLNKKKNNT